jgi:hypothetical protein
MKDKLLISTKWMAGIADIYQLINKLDVKRILDWLPMRRITSHRIASTS